MRALTCGMRAGQICQYELNVADDRAQDIVEVMRDTAGERADGFEPLRLTQRCFEPRSLTFGAASLSDISNRNLQQLLAIAHERHSAHFDIDAAAIEPVQTLLDGW